MTRSGSISARVSLPESLLPDAPRRELRAGVTGVDLELGGVSVRAGDLPLFRIGDGELRQCLRLAVSAEHDHGVARFSVTAGGTPLDSATLDVGAGVAHVRLFVPAVDAPTTVELTIELRGGLRRSDPVELRPQRRWRVFVVHHSHLDIGYTDPQARVLRQHLAYLDSALDYAAADDGFRWTIESNIVLERWLASRPAPLCEELLGLLRDRRFEACALPFTMHTEALSIDELARQLRFAHKLRELHGVEVLSAMQTDVPGSPPGLPLVLADAGVPYLAVAHNWTARAAPWLTGAATLPRAFYRQTASGKRVLVWHTDSPHGMAYLEGNLLGLAESEATAAELLPEYLAALAARGYPYRSEPLGVPAERAPYPHDVLHLRVQGMNADNAAPSVVPAQVARAWNETYAWPRLEVATNRDFFEALPNETLETFSGDWADWWADGLGSAARAVGFNRRAQATVRTAQTLHAMAGSHCDPDRAYESMALFDEHTWHAAHPLGDAVDGRASGGLQWQTKAALATDALARAEELLDAGRAHFASPERDASVLVLNPAGFARTDVVTVFLPVSRFEPGRPLAVVDAETQERVPSAVAPPETARNRPRGCTLSFVAAEVPAVGFRRYQLVAEETPFEVTAGLENEHYRLELDLDGGYALQLVDRELGVDLVDPASAFGLGQIVHDRYASALKTTMRIPTESVPVTPGAGEQSNVFVAARTVPGRGVVVGRISNAVEERVTVRLAGAGCDWIESTFRLVRGVRRVDVEHRLAKVATTEKEGVFVVFPFALRDPSVAYELTGGVGGGAAVPGSADYFHAIRHWVALQDVSATVAWSTLEAPLVQLGNVFLPYQPYPRTIEGAGPGLVASWAMNNVWDTNFPASQGGETVFSYSIASAPPWADARALGIETAAAQTQSLVGVLGPTAGAASGSFCEIDAPGVEVVMLAADGVHLQSYADAAVEVRVGDRSVTVGPGDYVTVPLGA